MVIPPAVGAATHTNDPTRFRHLIIDLAESGRHLIGDGTRDYHHI